MTVNPFLLAGCGAAIGGLGALVGMGGGFLLVPLLTLGLGLPMHRAVAAGLVAMAAGAATSTRSNFAKGLVNVRIGIGLEVASIVGASAGVLVSSQLPAPLLRQIFGCVAGGVGLWLTLRPPSPPPPASEDLDTPEASPLSPSWPALGLLGGIAGFLAGLLGVGGGFLKSPGLVFLVGMSPRRAAATSLATVLITVSVGAFGHWRLGNLDPSLAVPLAGGFVLGALAASRFENTVPDWLRRRLISGSLLAAGAAMLWSAL